MMNNFPATDNHIHVDPINGEGPVEIALKFERSGGTAMIVPNKPTWTVSEQCSYHEAMSLVTDYVNTINHETGIKAFAVVGVHPAELSRLIKNGMAVDKSEEIIRDALELAQGMVLEGSAIAIGEVGRPHYEVSPEEMEAQNRLLLYAMELAKEAECPVQLHTESAGPEQFQEFREMADQAGLKPSNVIKHFSGPMILPEENHGLTPSLIATGDVIRNGIKKGNNFLMETDFLDDKTRPGAVLGPKTVPRRTRKLLESGMFSEEDVYKIHVENVERIYDIDLEL
jgi:TatD-related deoxyribonuclease